MTIEFRDTIRQTDWIRATELFEAVGWGHRPPDVLERTFRQSSYVRAAYENDRLVGLGRTVDDGQYYGLIVDLIVDPENQGQGIGTELLRQLRDCMSSFLFCTLTAAPGKDGFYLGQGWQRQSSSFIWPVDAEQASHHCKDD